MIQGKLYEFMTHGHNPSSSSVINCVLYTQGKFQKRKKSGHLYPKAKEKETPNLLQIINQYISRMGKHWKHYMREMIYITYL